MKKIEVTIFNEREVINIINAFLTSNGTVQYGTDEIPAELKKEKALVIEGEDRMLTAVLYDFIQSKRLKEINQIQDAVWNGWAVLICS